MGNTADLAMVQKTIIDTLHKEGKSQRVITERGGCSRSAVSKHIQLYRHLPGHFIALQLLLILFSSRTWHLPTVPKVPKAGSMTMVLLCLIGQQTRLTWTPENLDERHQTQQCRWPEGRYQSNLGFITPEQCHRLIASMPHWCSNSCKRRPFCHTCHTFQKPDISV